MARIGRIRIGKSVLGAGGGHDSFLMNAAHREETRMIIPVLVEYLVESLV